MLTLEAVVLSLVIVNNFEFTVHRVCERPSDGFGLPPPIMNGFDVLGQGRPLGDHRLT